jgi:tRNA (guanine-N7-)-methyltransferase
MNFIPLRRDNIALEVMEDHLVPDQKNGVPALEPSPEGGWDLELKLAQLEKPLDFDKIFGRKAQLEIEVGFGSGLFLATEAFKRPEVNFFALEKDMKQVRRSKDKWRRRNLLNTRAMHCDAFYFLEEYVADESVDSYIILFSDPWFKKRHHKRRVFSPRLLPILERTLKPGGTLVVKTDISEYYEVMVELLDPAVFLDKVYDKRLDLNPEDGDIVTNYQRKAVEKGHPIHSMLYRKKNIKK